MSLPSINFLHLTVSEIQPVQTFLQYSIKVEQAIRACEWALCQLTVCSEIQSRSERRKGHKSCALQMVLRSKVPSKLLRCNR